MPSVTLKVTGGKTNPIGVSTGRTKNEWNDNIFPSGYYVVPEATPEE
jgi:hypothetical protein